MSVHAIPRTTVLRDWPSANRPRDQKESARKTTKFQALTRRNLDSISQYGNVTGDDLFAMKVVSAVLPFRTNRYVIEHLIDWDRVPDDPVYKLVFPQRGMLGDGDFRRIADPHGAGCHRRRRSSALPPKSAPISIRIRPGSGSSTFPVKKARPSKDSSTNIAKPFCSFRAQGQTCHAYCTFCFRWAQFVGEKELKISTKDAVGLHRYLADHPKISDVLFTGGDPMIMKTRVMESYLRAFIEDPALAHVQNIRIGTKALTFWPHRFVNDEDADDLLRLLADLVRAGRHVAVMAHFNHWQEMRTDVVQDAIRRIRDTGAVIRSQAPLLAQINNDPRHLGADVARAGAPRRHPLLHVRGARYRPEALLRSAAGALLGGLQERDPAGLGPGPHGPGAEHECHARQGRGAGRAGGRGRKGLRCCASCRGATPTGSASPSSRASIRRPPGSTSLEPAFGEDKFFFEDGRRALTA